MGRGSGRDITKIHPWAPRQTMSQSAGLAYSLLRCQGKALTVSDMHPSGLQPA